MNRIHKNLWLLVTVIFAVALTTYVLADAVTHPWHVITELGADGGKNNFTYLYQVLYGKGLKFTGMNYPYGEHIVYTDGQPILSVPLSYFKSHLTIGRALSIMWWLIALSYVAAIVYSYKLLVHFGVKPLIAMCFAGLIVMFTPQELRISGHYALSYACIIPMLFYWSVMYYSSGRYKYPVYIFILGFLTSFLHPYFAAVILVWAGLYTVGYLLFGKEKIARKIAHTAPLIISVALVFIVFGVIMKLTDPATDRPSVPYGILGNCTHINDVISSPYMPFWSWLSEKKICRSISQGGEGYTYTGLAVLLVIIISFVIGVIKKLRKRTAPVIVSATGFQHIWLFIAVAALLFSMGAPFTWHMEWLLDYVSAFRQFRTLGRFAWIFYYVITIYGAVVVYEWYARLVASRRVLLAYLVLLLPMAIWTYETLCYVKLTREKMANGYKNYDEFICLNGTTWPQFLASHHYAADSFQASIILRFFEVGSEKIWLGRDVSVWGIADGMQSGLQLHLPMVDCMASRTSWGQSFSQVKIAGGPYTHKQILQDIPSQKPFLLLCLDKEPIEPDQAYLIEASDTIGHFMNCNVYACYPERIKANDKKHADQISAVAPFARVGDTCIKNTGGWYAAHFDDVSAAHVLFGKGALPYTPDSLKVIAAKAPVIPAYDNQMYEFSCWFLTPANDFKSPYATVEMLDSAGNVITAYDALTKECTDNNGLWLRDHVYFPMPARTRYVRCNLVKQYDNTYSAMDELLIMPADAIIISKSADGSLLVNNHLFKPQ